VVDARHTTKSYMIAYEILKEIGRRNPESIVEVVFKNEKGLLKELATWCEVTGNELLTSEPSDNGKEIRCLVQKSLAMERRGSIVSSAAGSQGANGMARSICVLISTADLESLVLPLDKALSAAMLGMDVHVCFEGAGVKVLKKGYRATVSGLLGRIFTSVAESTIKDNRGAPLPCQAIEILEELEAHFYVCGPSLKENRVREEDVSVKSFTIASTMTMMDLMAKSDVDILTKGDFERS
jgi:predicted peroxiredoxin